MPTRRASATWEGGLKEGRGNFSGESGAVDGAYNFSRFEEESGGTNPEELLAAAEASCFSMALAAALGGEGATPIRIATDAACTVEKAEAGFRITTIQLQVRAEVADVDEETFQRVVEATRIGCPVSAALLGNVDIQVEATLEEPSGSQTGS